MQLSSRVSSTKNFEGNTFSNGAVAFREPVSVSGFFQFWIILHKTIRCILRDKVKAIILVLTDVKKKDQLFAETIRF